MGNPVNSELELSSAQQHQPSPASHEKGDERGLFEEVQDGESPIREAQDSPLLTSISRSNGDGSSQHLRPNNDSAPCRTRATDTMKNGSRIPENEVKSILQQKTSNMPETGGSGTAARAALWPVREEDITPQLIQEMEITYAAFVRDDIYGTYGRGPLPILEKVLVALALVTIVPIRLAFVMLVLVLYYCICKVCTLFRHPGEEDEGQENYVHLTGVRRRVIVFTGRWLARTILFGLGFYRIKVKQKTPDVMQRLDLGRGGEGEEKEDNEVLLGESKGLPGAIVSNHISYLDILYHMSASFPSFVAKRSVARLPLVGLMSKCMGCVYVQRESKTPNFKGVSGIVTERLRAAHASPGAPIFLLFPEGTTTNGDYLLPFKTGAFVAGTPVLPVILKYPYARFSPAWETMSGIRHIVLLLCQGVNYLEVTRLPVYYPSSKEISDPRTYSNNVRTLMSTEGDLRKSDIGLQEKRVYHAALAGKTFSRSDSNVQ